MAHDRDHGRAGLQGLGGVNILVMLDVDIGIADALDIVAELGDQQLRRVLVDDLVHGDGHAHLEQRFDEVGGALRHAVGELADGDRVGHVHVAHLLGRRPGLHMGALFLLARAAERGEAAGAGIAVVAERPADGELAGLTPVVAAAGGARGLGPARCRSGVAVALAGALVVLDGDRRRLSGFGRGGALRLFLGGKTGGLGGVLLGLAIVFGAALLVFGLRFGLGLLAAARILERLHPLLFGLAHQARRTLLRGLGGGRARGGLRRGLGRRRGDRLGRSDDGLRLRRLGLAGTAQDAALLDLNDDGVRAAMAEALLHLAGLDRALQAQRCPGAQFRLVSRLAHSKSFIHNPQPKRPASPPWRRLAHPHVR